MEDDTDPGPERIDPANDNIGPHGGPDLQPPSAETWRKTARYRSQIDASREGVRQNLARNRALNATHRPRTLLSGLIFCGCCDGSYAGRGRDRYACTNHVLGNGCDNARTVNRKVLEARVLDGLRDRMITPDVAAEAMRAYAEETNRLNRERRNSADAIRKELAETAKAIAEIVRVIEQGGYHRALSDRLTELETRQDSLTARLSDTPPDTPDLHPGIAATYRRRIERLTAALDQPDNAAQAAAAIREIIERIVITPGPTRGDFAITLQGELSTILNWIERTGKPGYKPTTETASSRLLVSGKTGACHWDPCLYSPRRPNGPDYSDPNVSPKRAPSHLPPYSRHHQT